MLVKEGRIKVLASQFPVVKPTAIEQPGVCRSYTLTLDFHDTETSLASESVGVLTFRNQIRTWKTIDAIRSFLAKQLPSASLLVVELKN